MHQLMVDLLVSETTMTKARIEEMMKVGHDCYITPTEAVKLGIVDKIISR